MSPPQTDFYYLDETIQANLAGNTKLAYSWRLSTDAALNFLSQSTPNKIFTPLEVPFSENLTRLMMATQEVNQRLIPSLKTTSEKKNPHTVHWLVATDETKQPAENYRYWMARAKTETSLSLKKEIEQASHAMNKYGIKMPGAVPFLKEAIICFKTAQQIDAIKENGDSIEHELFVSRWKTAAHAAIRAACTNIHAEEARLLKNHLLTESWEKITRLTKQALLWRTKASEATQKNQEAAALQYSLAAYWARNSADDQIKFLKAETCSLSYWKAASQAAEKTLEYYEKLFELPSFKLSLSLETRKKSIHWSEIAADYRRKAINLHLQGNEILANRWKEAAESAEYTAKLWDQIALSIISKNCFGFLSSFRTALAHRSEKKTNRKFFKILMSEVSFCIPEQCLPTPQQQKTWKEDKAFGLKKNDPNPTTHSWLYQTWNFLQEAGITCNISTQIPNQGIAITLSISFHPSFEVDPSLPTNIFLVDVIADGSPHPGAHLHLVQNKTYARRLPRSFFMPHWPQALLIPRNQNRGPRFETLSFFGDIQNLAPELRSTKWLQRLHRELDITLDLREPDRWHDYSDVDCVIAIRDFSTSRHIHKPATKLYNAWHAGVPFIGGRDSAYAADGHPGKDYLVATSLEEVFQHLKRLKEDGKFRATLIQNGFLSGKAFTREAILKHWKKLTQETLPNLASKWQQKSTRQRRWFFFTQHLFCLLDRFFK